MYFAHTFFFYQSTITTFLQTKTSNKKRFIKKQLTKHDIT